MDQNPPLTIPDILSYVADTFAEPRRIVRQPGLRTLNYLLDMARLEAERLGKLERERPGTIDPGRR